MKNRDLREAILQLRGKEDRMPDSGGKKIILGHLFSFSGSIVYYYIFFPALE